MLPQANKQWPPDPPIADWNRSLLEWEHWYSGDVRRLESFYQEATDRTHVVKFWSGMAENDVRAIHMPLATDIAATSASLLFSEPPKWSREGDEDGNTSGDNEAENRLKEMWDALCMESLLLEAAEIAAGLSGVFLKIDTAPDVSDVPIVNVVRPASAWPVFSPITGQLQEVTFWQVVKREEDPGKIWYLFEERTRNDTQLVIRYRLFSSNDGRTLSEAHSLDAIPETKAMSLTPDDTVAMDEGLGVIYVPNRRPNTMSPGSPMGVSDYAGAVSLLDALDEAYSSWMRDIRLGMGRLLASKELMTSTGKFDPFKEVFLQCDISSVLTGKESKNLIDEIQFELRTEEHQTTCTNLVKEIVSRCGYAPQSFGMGIEGRAESGTALRIRERKSLMTRQKKGRYWCVALRQLFWQLQLMDRAALQKSYTPALVSFELEDSVVPDLAEVAQTVKDLSLANAISTEVAVKMVHADWTDKQVQQEVERIQSQSVVMTPFEEAPGGGEGGDE